MEIKSNTLGLKKELSPDIILDLLYLHYPSYRGKESEFLSKKIKEHFDIEISAREIFLAEEPNVDDLILDAKLIYKNLYGES